jgi:hypothetical protein
MSLGKGKCLYSNIAYIFKCVVHFEKTETLSDFMQCVNGSLLSACSDHNQASQILSNCSAAPMHYNPSYAAGVVRYKANL